METPTPLQRQIEHLVTNGRGYTPATIPDFSKVSGISYRFIFQHQLLRDTLYSMEMQQESPSNPGFVESVLNRILRNTPHQDNRKFIEEFRSREESINKLDLTIPKTKFRDPSLGANAGHSISSDPDQMRAYRAKLLAMGLNPFAVDQPPRHVYDVFSSDARLSSPDLGKNWEYLHPSKQPEEREFLYLRQPEKEFPFKKPWKHPQDDDLLRPLRQPDKEFPLIPKESDSLYILPRPKLSSNPAPEPLDSQDFLDELLKRLEENREKDSKKKWIE